MSAGEAEETPKRVRQLPPFHCPYCGDEGISPYGEAGTDWQCEACLRAFTVRLLATGVRS